MTETDGDRDGNGNGGDGLVRQHLFELDFVSARTVEDLSASVLSLPNRSLTQGMLPVIVTPNVDHLVKRDRSIDAVANDLMNRAAMVLPDGQPIVWAAKLLRRPLESRLPGSSLVEEIWPLLVRDQRRVLVIASSEESAEQIRTGAPDDTAIEAIVAPMLDVKDRSSFDKFVEECTREAVDSHVEFVFVTLGFPKQENIIAGMIERWPEVSPSPAFLAIGASFDMMHGLVTRAPHVFQRLGLEWFFRFVQEPRRLFRRYFVDDVAFLGLVLRERRAVRTR